MKNNTHVTYRSFNSLTDSHLLIVLASLAMWTTFNSLTDSHHLTVLIAIKEGNCSFNSLTDSHALIIAMFILAVKFTFNSLTDSHFCKVIVSIKLNVVVFQFPNGFSQGEKRA